MRIERQFNDAEIYFISTASNEKDKEHSMQDKATVPMVARLVRLRSQKWIHWHPQAHQDKLREHRCNPEVQMRKCATFNGAGQMIKQKQNYEMKGQRDHICNPHM